MKRRHSSTTIAKTLEFAILLALPVISHYLFPLMAVVPRPYNYLGLVVMVLGVVLSFQASAAFRRALTGFQLRGATSSLVTTGPFAFSRNPMYLGFLLWLLGLAILLGSLSPFLFPALFFIVANFIMIPMEERSLEHQFGEEYNDYRKKVRRWV